MNRKALWNAAWIAVVALVGGFLLLRSCQNVWLYDKGNIRFFSLWGTQYQSLVVGTPTRPYRGEPAMLVRLSDETVIDLDQIEVVQLIGKCKGRSSLSGMPFSSMGSPPMEPDTKWPDGTLRLQDESRVFIVHDGKLMSFQLSWGETDEGRPPEIADKRTGQWHQLPLSELAVIELFGAADQIREYSRE